MKLLKWLLLFVLFLGVIGYGIYYVAMDFISEKAASSVTEQLDDETTYAEMRETVESMPEIKAFIEEGADVQTETLPFTTKEEATKLIVKKVGAVELKELYDQYQNGMTEEDVQDVLYMLENKLTDQEILALKAIAYQTFQQ